MIVIAIDPGLTGAIAVPLTLVTAAALKRSMGLDSTKPVSVAKARLLFPTVDLDRKKDHNRAEALLLAEYSRRMFTGCPGSCMSPAIRVGRWRLSASANRPEAHARSLHARRSSLRGGESTPSIGLCRPATRAWSGNWSCLAPFKVGSNIAITSVLRGGT